MLLLLLLLLVGTFNATPIAGPPPRSTFTFTCTKPPPPGPNLWPLPAKFSNGSAVAMLAAGFRFGCAGKTGAECGTVLPAAFARYETLIFAERSAAADAGAALSGLSVNVEDWGDAGSKLQSASTRATRSTSLSAAAPPSMRQPSGGAEAFDALGETLDKRVVIQVCPSNSAGLCGYSTTTIDKVVAKGYKAVFNDYAKFYLGFGGGSVNWATIYDTEPLEGIDEPAQQKLVLGAELCKWGGLTDASIFDAKVWPRLAAASETFWSPRDANRTSAGQLSRIEWFRCLLLRRGVGAAPVTSKIFAMGPGGPGSCFT